MKKPVSIHFRAIVVVCILFSFVKINAQNYSIDLTRRYQTNEGWGVSLCWWAKECGKWPEERLDSLVEWLVSPDGLNYNVFRYNIGGGDDPNWSNCTEHHMGARGGKGLRAEMEGFKDGLDKDYDWTRDEGQRRIMLMIKKKRPDAIFEAFSNSAPWWMTVSGCCAGGPKATDDNLRVDMYDTFAHYLVDVCKHYKDVYGLEFYSLDPFNEPVTNYWGQNGGQEGCHVSTEAQMAFVKVLSPILKESGLKTVISASDETSVKQSTFDLAQYSKRSVLPLVGQWNTHTYQGSREEKVRLKQLADSLHIRLWQSETGDGGRGLHGNLKIAQRLMDDIRFLQPVVWCDWQYVEENFDQWSLVKCDHEWKTYERHKNYYVREHFSRFIPVGYTWVESGDEHTLSAVSPDGRTLILVALNTEREATQHNVELPNEFKKAKVTAYRTSRRENVASVSDFAVDSNHFSFSLQPISIMTFVMQR